MSEALETGDAGIGTDAALSDATERQPALEDVHDRAVESHAASVRFGNDLAPFLTFVAKIIERQRALMPVYVANELVFGAIWHDRQDRSENLLLHHRHVIGNVENRQRHDPMPFRKRSIAVVREVEHCRALGFGIIEQTLEPRELSVIDDTGEIGVACRVGVAFGNLSAECGDEAFHLIDMDEGIVSGDAGLAGVEQLAEH